MSGRPNKEQIALVIKISRTMMRLSEESDDIVDAITAARKRKEEINYAYGKLSRERDELMRKMDVHSSQSGNFGYENRQEAFLNCVSAMQVVGAAEEPKSI
jgi:lipopolysaccharide biosynthesis regulator YciM